MHGFHNSRPVAITCYTLLWYYAPVFLRQGTLQIDYGAQPQVLLPHHLIGAPVITLLVLVSCFLPSLFFSSSSGRDTLPTIFRYVQAWMLYTAFLLHISHWDPSYAFLLGILLNQHLLWTLVGELSGNGKRRIVSGATTRATARIVLILLPTIAPLLRPYSLTHPKDLTLIIFIPEILGVLIDVVNHVCLASIAVFV